MTTGPFETEREVLDLPAVKAIYAAMRASNRRGGGKEACHRLLEEACAAAGAELAAYDHRILLWLAGYEPQVCAVFAGIITRAHRAAVSGLPAGYAVTIGQAFRDAITWCETQAAEACAECAAAPDGLCDRHTEYLDQIGLYRSLAAELGEAAP